MNFKPLFKLVELAQCIAKGKDSGVNIWHVERQANNWQKEKLNCRWPLMDSGIKQFIVCLNFFLKGYHNFGSNQLL